jgi:hypothetical protein
VGEPSVPLRAERDGQDTQAESNGRAPAPAGGLPSSRIGGAIVLAVLVAAIVVGVILLTGGSSKSHNGTTASKTTAASGSGPSVSRIAMRPADPSSHSLGLLQILQEGSKRAFYLVAEKVPPTNGFFYALWLSNPNGASEPLGKAPPVGSNHRLEGGGALPANAERFQEVLLTRETSTHASHPGTVVLHGHFSLAGENLPTSGTTTGSTTGTGGAGG